MRAATPPTVGLLPYLRHPVPTLPPPGRGAPWAFLRLWLACLLTVLLTGPIALLGAEVSGVDNRIADVPGRALLVLGLLVAPVLEEVTFRLPLAPLRAAWLLIAAVGAAVMLAPWGVLAVVAVLGALAAPPARRALEQLWERRFRVVFYTSALAFGLVHAFNWELEGLGGRAFVVVPLLVLPQTGLGLVLGYARVRLGLAGAMALHAVYNGTILALALLPGA